MSQIYGIILKRAQKFCNFAAMTKKNIMITGLLSGIWLASLLTSGCDRPHTSSETGFTVTCRLDGKIHHDSATLLLLEDAYHKLRVCGNAHDNKGTFTFTGQTEGEKVALIRWDNDTTKPFLFVLEPGKTDIRISPNSWVISGGRQNTEYQKFVNWRNSIMNARAATWQEYLKMAADSSLKRDDELRMVRQDSLLNDSLQRMTVERINRGDAVGRILRERYGNQLDKEHMRKLR